MKEYESVKLKENKRFLYFSNGIDKNGDIIGFTGGINYDVAYVDYKNRLHNLSDFAWSLSGNIEYWIHGKKYNYKDWLNKKEEILLQIHREEMLNDI